MRHLVETETGVYQPLSIKLAAVPPLLLLLVITGQALAGKIPLSISFPFVIGLAAMFLIPVLVERWKYGKLGKPTVALQAGNLIIALPNDSRGCLSVQLAHLKEIIVYGPEGRHYYRLIQEDGSFVEGAPAWPKTIDEVVIQFLKHRLSTMIKVTLKEPQSLFAHIRGDGP
jgi:hypothetical protein